MTREREQGALYYFGSSEKVMIGDRVRIKRWLRRDLRGVVCYLPGIGPKHRELEYDDVRQWAIKLEDGTVLASIYWPERAQPGKEIVLEARSDEPGLKPTDHLE